jgi:hypothetical protein
MVTNGCPAGQEACANVVGRAVRRRVDRRKVRCCILLSSVEDDLMIGVCDGGCRLWVEVVFG